MSAKWTDPVAQDILFAATAEFAAHGMAGARIDAIAAGTGTSKRMIYYHFGSKQGLYEAVLAHAYLQVRKTTAQAQDIDAMPALDALLLLVGEAFDTHLAHPDFIRLVMYENLHGGQTIAGLTEIAAVTRRGLGRVDALLARGLAEGSMRSGISARDVYLLFIAQCFYHVSNRLSLSAVLGAVAETTDEGDRSRRAAVIESVKRYVWPGPPLSAECPPRP